MTSSAHSSSPSPWTQADDDAGVVERIRRARDSLSATEEALAAQIIAGPETAVSATAAELAAAAGVSQASVVRFARALGYKGLPDLRLALAQDLSRRELERKRAGAALGCITPEDSLEELTAKVAFHESRSIEQTLGSLNLKAVERIARAVVKRPLVTTLGMGSSSLVAADLAHKLQRIGLLCHFSPDTHLQLVHAALLDEDDVAIGFSFSGHSTEVRHGLQMARKRGALTVAVTGSSGSPVAQAASVVLVTLARRTEMAGAPLACRMAQLAVVDVLFARIAQLSHEGLGEALRVTSDALGGYRSQD